MTKKIEKLKCFFEGWYFKQVAENFSISFIPAYFCNKNKKEAVIQVIENNTSHIFNFNIEQISVTEKPFSVKIGNNVFTKNGINVNLQNENTKIIAKLTYSNHIKTNKNIMGVLKFVPFLECKHGVISAFHNVCGTVLINDKIIEFKNGAGYIETDSGKSFPKEYLWTQCNKLLNNEPFNIMLSVAIVPLVINLLGCICIITYKGKNYTLATYFGAKVISFTNSGATIKQGSKKVIVEKLTQKQIKLLAPTNGNLKRTIKESISCKVKYTLIVKQEVVFEIICDNASFEFLNVKNDEK